MNYKKLSTLLLCGMMLVGCSAKKEESSTGVYTPGTYSATSSGRNGDVTVNLTVDANKITDLSTDHEETSGIGDVAIEELTTFVLENQAIPSDTVTSATISSKAFIEALTSAIEEAGGDPSTMTGAVSSTSTTEEYETSADIVIIGAGAAGMTAAVTASNEGASVILLEKSSTTGGNTPAAANGVNAADSKIQLENEDYKNANASVEGLENLQSQNEDARSNLVKAFAENSGEVIDWLSDLGVDFEVEISEDGRNAVQNYYMLQARADGSTGITMTNAVTKALKDTDVKLYLNMDAHTLVQDENGAISGVIATDASGNEVTFSSKKVLIATGGFGHNQELLAKYNPSLANATTDEIAPTTGEGLEMALAVGAKTVNLGDIQTFPVVAEGYGMVTPNKLPGGFKVSAVIVNDNAERFTTEGFEIGDAILEQPNGNAYMIFTEEQMNDDLQKMYDAGYISSADTAKELGEELCLDGDKLQETVDAYNEDVSDGVDDAYQKENPITLTGTLYGFKYGVGAHYFMGGILINEDTQVLDENEEPIENLYAAGEVTGGFHGTQRIDGSGIGDSFVFGRIAGKKLAQAVQE